jgi:pimeloyl-ACP methyl ester carboxylesterase
LHREIPGSRLEIVPNAGHLVLDDAPDAIGKLIGNFAGAYTPSRAVAAR